jgi:PilZ domain
VDDKRKSTRRRVLKGAVAAFNGRYSTYNCVIRDISETGCKLILDDALKLPEFFDLIIESDATQVPCQVVRRSLTTLGIMFLGPFESTGIKRSQITPSDRPASAIRLRKIAPVASAL